MGQADKGRQFCEANDEFVLEQARRIAGALPPSHVTVTTLKVAVVNTEIRRQFPLWMKLVVPLLDPFGVRQAQWRAHKPRLVQRVEQAVAEVGEGLLAKSA